MLTDYHLHLRRDGEQYTSADHHTAENAAAYRSAADERGIAELGVSEHIYRFTDALGLWRHPFWERFAGDDLGEYCSYVREATDLRLGIEADFVPGAEDRTAELLARHDFDYVVGSVHFIRDGAVDMDDFSVWGSGRSVGGNLAALLRGGGRSARSGLFDIIAHPDLVKYWGDGARRPDGDLRRFYEIAAEAIADTQVAFEVSTAGLRKPAAELYPAPGFLEMLVETGAPVALSSDAHTPHDLGAGYDVAVEALEALGVREIALFDHRARTLAPLGAGGSDARRHRL